MRELQSGPSLISLFSGCGGLDLGFEAAGFQTAAMVEIAEYATETARLHFQDSKVIGPPNQSGDINELSMLDIPRRADILIGGPPCQSFSVAASQRFLKGDKKFKRIGFKDKTRGTLIHRYLEVLDALRPKAFVIENVPGLMHLDDGAELNDILAFVRDIGYKVAEPKVVQAADYGVPQYRQRLLVVGARGRRTPAIPTPTHGGGTLFEGGLVRHVTVAEALAGLRASAMNHVPREHSAESIARYRRLTVGKRDHLGRVDRLDPRRPSKTVIAGGMNGGGRSHLHPFLARTMTVRECARLQTFPDDFEFLGNMSRQFTQVGNAVPPLLAEVVARALGEQLFDLEYNSPLTFSVNRSGRSVEACVSSLLRQSSNENERLYEDIARQNRMKRSA
jgi:DNA (cytosine-5)-methyltransferase 1